MRYIAVSLKPTPGWVVFDTKKGKVAERLTPSHGRKGAERAARWWNHSQPDRDDWNTSERRFMPRYRRPSDSVSPVLYRDNRLVWTATGHYNAMPMAITVNGR